MPEFTSPADIGNLALQFCGQPPMSATLGFLDTNARARAVSAVYGKLRRAELRRALFKFANKVAVIRAVDLTTMKIVPPLWASTVTYVRGSIVADINGTMWISALNGNTGSGNQPGVNFQAWFPYFGPMTCDVYNAGASYFSGEMVYTTAGDGTYNIFLSLISNNTLDPSLPVQWNFSTMYNLGQVVQSFPAWASGTAYQQGQAVLYTDGNYYVSLVEANTGNVPATTVGVLWALLPPVLLTISIYPTQSSNVPYNQSSPVIEWDIGTTYALGNFVTFNNRVYVSLVNNNYGQFPYITNSTYWAKVTNVTSYQSLINFNINNNPADTPAAWVSTTAYTVGTLVAATDGFNYLATNNSTGQQPANGASPGYWSAQTLTAWTTSLTAGLGSQQWVQIGGCNSPSDVSLVPENPLYPAGAGPSSQSETRNLFRLPAGFIREAPQDPKAGSVSWLGAPSGLFPNDWLYRGSYIISRQADPIVLQFQADVQDVTEFDDMFAVGLAERIALTIAEQLTQSTAVVQVNVAAYREFMGEARTVSGVETGADEPAQDDFVVCRL